MCRGGRSGSTVGIRPGQRTHCLWAHRLRSRYSNTTPSEYGRELSQDRPRIVSGTEVSERASRRAAAPARGGCGPRRGGARPSSPRASAPSQFSRRSSTKTHCSGGSPIALGAQQEDLGLGLVHAHLAGDDHAVEQLAGTRAGRSVPRRSSWRSGRCGCRRPWPCAPRRSSAGPARMPANSRSIRSVACPPRRAAGRGRRRTRPRSICPSSRRLRSSARASGFVAEQVRGTHPPVQALRHAELAERLEDVGRQHAAEVDEQSLHEPACAISRAFSASSGTPSSNSAPGTRRRSSRRGSACSCPP